MCRAILSNQNALRYHLRYVHAIDHSTPNTLVLSTPASMIANLAQSFLTGGGSVTTHKSDATVTSDDIAMVKTKNE